MRKISLDFINSEDLEYLVLRAFDYFYISKHDSF